MNGGPKFCGIQLAGADVSPWPKTGDPDGRCA